MIHATLIDVIYSRICLLLVYIMALMLRIERIKLPRDTQKPARIGTIIYRPDTSEKQYNYLLIMPNSLQSWALVCVLFLARYAHRLGLAPPAANNSSGG